MVKKRRNRVDEVALIRAWCDWGLKSMKDYLDAILNLPPEERTKDRGASFGSIQNIYLHIVEDYIWWFECVPNGKPGDEELVGKNFSEEDLRQLEKRIESSVRKITNSLTTRELARTFVVEGTGGDGKPYRMTTCTADIIWHMVEEQLQHIGEINALFWQMDIDPPTHAWFSSKLAFTYNA